MCFWQITKCPCESGTAFDDKGEMNVFMGGWVCLWAMPTKSYRLFGVTAWTHPLHPDPVHPDVHSRWQMGSVCIQCMWVCVDVWVSMSRGNLTSAVIFVISTVCLWLIKGVSKRKDAISLSFFSSMKFRVSHIQAGLLWVKSKLFRCCLYHILYSRKADSVSPRKPYFELVATIKLKIWNIKSGQRLQQKK